MSIRLSTRIVIRAVSKLTGGVASTT